jgi:hypothetical protein
MSHDAAARLRTAASQIREAIQQAERRERERRHAQAPVRLSTLPLGPAV